VRGASSTSRVRAVANAHRDWALAQPGAYRLAYESIHASGVTHDAERIAPASRRSVKVLLGVVAEACEPPTVPISAALRKHSGA
jgi:hypothetical protein